MSDQDFVRRLPSSDQGLRRRDRVQQRLHIDFILLLLLAVISTFGLFVLYSANGQSASGVQRQALHFVLAYGVMLTAAQVPVHLLQRLALWGYLGGMVLLVLVLVMGVGANGAQRWLEVGGFRFQPSEFMKLGVPIAVAAYLGRRLLPPSLKHVCVAVGLSILPALLIGRQPDLGTALLVAVAGLTVVFFAGLPWRYLLIAMVAGLLSLWPMWQFVLHGYQKRRILTLLNPEADRLGAGWNIIQSKTAIGSGGVSGKGWLQGTQSQLDFLPEGHTDFIIAVLAEEFGLLGVLFLLGLYGLLIARTLVMATRAQDSFGRLLAASIAITFFVYVFVNVGMVAGLLPVVGVPLPLVSQGGTAIVTLMAGFGIVMALATERRRIIR